MPLFEYRCSACQHLEEVLQKHSDPAPDACPKCGQQKTLAKELSMTSFQLKGGGWYKDLYSSTKKDAPASSSSSSDSSSGTASTPASASTPSSTSSSGGTSSGGTTGGGTTGGGTSGGGKGAAAA